MALFVTLVVVMILFVVVYQLWHCALLETRIAENQGGYMKSTLAMHSMVPYALTLLQEDLRNDVDNTQSSGLTGEGDLTTGTGSTATGTPGVSTSVASLGSGSSAAASPQGGLYDSINEALFESRTQTINEVQLKIDVVDCERKINLNKLFQYVSLWLREQEGVAKLGENPEDLAAGATGEGAENTDRINTNDVASSGDSGSSSLSQADQDQLNKIMGGAAPGAAGQEEGLEEEWQEPDQAEFEAAERMVADLIIHMVETNINDNGLAYKRLYNADEISKAIVNYVVARKRDDVQNFIYDTAELLQIEEVTPELYYGPTPVEVQDPTFELGADDEGFRRDEFGDLVYQYGAWDMMDEGFSLGQYGSFNDFEELKTSFGLSGSLRPGVTSLSNAAPPDNEDGTGIMRPPRSVGLKDLFCTFSTGKVNLNTAPLEVILSLLQGGDPNGGAWDPDQKLEVGQAIVYWRDQYTEDYLLELEEQALEGYTEEDELGDFSSMFGAQDLQTNIYTNIQDVNKIKIGDEEILKDTQVDSGASERSPSVLVRNDLKSCTVFRSDYFEIRMVAQGEGFRQEANMVVHRDINNKALSVIYYRERQD